jgi:hypothetical protein
MADNPPPDATPIAFSPETYARHSEAITYVENLIRTRAPRPGTGGSRGAAPGAWGKLDAGATITAAVGLTLGTGRVKLCDRDGVVLDPYSAYGGYDDDGVSVDVVNAGAEITGGGSGKIVQLGWTLGEWCVTCPGGS